MPKRIALTVLALVIVGAVGWTAWTAYQTQQDLVAAESQVDVIRAAIEDDDPAARDAAAAELVDRADSAAGRVDGWWWDGLSHLPVFGDDVSGIQALSRSLKVVGEGAVLPLADVADRVDDAFVDGAIQVDVVESLDEPVTQAHEALEEGATLVEAESSDGYVGPLKGRFEEYRDTIRDLADAMGSAQKTVEVLPPMVGADGPKDYLFIFQNNAELRATAGLPGSWAVVHAEDGRLTMEEQGSSASFDVNGAEKPITEVTDAEKALYGVEIARFWQDPNFTPDWPRAVEIFQAFWDTQYPEQQLDGMLSIDVVGLSYLLQVTGPVDVDGDQITADNAVQKLLNQVYLDYEDPTEQDAYFAGAARSIFQGVTGDLGSPLDFAEAMGRAAREGRFLVTPYDDEPAAVLADTVVAGATTTGDDTVGRVDIAFNDGTGSKMSYYLDYFTDVESRSCAADGRQTLSGTVTFEQTIDPAEAQELPDYITGGGANFTDPGNQLVNVSVYGPANGSLYRFLIDGRAVTPDIVYDGNRPAARLQVELTNRKSVRITFMATTGAGQDHDTVVRTTPSLSGTGFAEAATTC